MSADSLVSRRSESEPPWSVSVVCVSLTLVRTWWGEVREGELKCSSVLCRDRVSDMRTSHLGFFLKQICKKKKLSGSQIEWEMLSCVFFFLVSENRKCHRLDSDGKWVVSYHYLESGGKKSEWFAAKKKTVINDSSIISEAGCCSFAAKVRLILITVICKLKYKLKNGKKTFGNPPVSVCQDDENMQAPLRSGAGNPETGASSLSLTHRLSAWITNCCVSLTLIPTACNSKFLTGNETKRPKVLFPIDKSWVV